MNIENLFRKAKNGKLPPDFDQWHLADKDGRTVAQAAYIICYMDSMEKNV